MHTIPPRWKEMSSSEFAWERTAPDELKQSAAWTAWTAWTEFDH